jgi:uncharacterized protein (DUF1697 family)
MATFIAMLRGINVGGHNILKMEQLRASFAALGYGKTRLSNAAIEKKLSVAATTRNWKTVNTLLEMTK